MKSLRCVKVLNNIFNQCVSIMISLWIYIEYHMILYSGKFLAVTTSSTSDYATLKKIKKKMDLHAMYKPRTTKQGIPVFWLFSNCTWWNSGGQTSKANIKYIQKIKQRTLHNLRRIVRWEIYKNI